MSIWILWAFYVVTIQSRHKFLLLNHGETRHCWSIHRFLCIKVVCRPLTSTKTQIYGIHLNGITKLSLHVGRNSLPLPPIYLWLKAMLTLIRYWIFFSENLCARLQRAKHRLPSIVWVVHLRPASRRITGKINLFPLETWLSPKYYRPHYTFRRGRPGVSNHTMPYEIIFWGLMVII